MASLGELPNGPDYIDTSLCHCALQSRTDTTNSSIVDAWRCIFDPNGQRNIYNGTKGLWFLPQNPGSLQDLNNTENWNGNPPALENTYVLKNGSDGTPPSFVPYDPDENFADLDTSDQICTGTNSTQVSKDWYKNVTDTIRGDSELAAKLCVRTGTRPILIQNATSWQNSSCNLGFSCPHNSVVRLPQYCPPVDQCYEARLAGGQCPPMGLLEPFACPHGNYCPPGGKSQIQCPTGNFCPMGAFQPTPCTIGAHCPPGSDRNMTFLPLILLALLDSILVIVTFVIKYKTRVKRIPYKRPKNARSFITRASTLIDKTQRNKQYSSLEDDDEVMLEARISSVQRTNTGFLAVMDNDFVFDKSASDEEKPNSQLHLFVQSLSKCIDGSTFGLSFDFTNLQFHPQKASKPVLSEVTGRIESGSFSAVMGGSGAGKSTFVNVLMGKQAHTGGITKVNGAPGRISKYKKIIGYVPQDDIVLPELTVRENILHSARIRLPCSWSDHDIQQHVDILVSCLNLSHVKNSLVGSPAAPVISGGQRKRVSIGIELAAAPMALFLDEPTSGLDATSASSIMKLLKALSRLGITIVTIIHQPRQEIFDSLDSILLLGAGRMIYQGQRSEVQGYFEGVGFKFPEHSNPADTIMDIIAGQGHLYKKTGDTGVEPLIEYWQTRQQNNYPVSEAGTVSVQEAKALRRSIRRRGAYWYLQMYYCFLRSLLQQWRAKSSFYFELGVGALAGFLIGLAELNAEGQNFLGIYQSPYEILSSAIDYSSVPQMSLLVGLAIGLTASAPGVKIFGEEKLIYWREAAAGHNRLAYYMGKVLSTVPRIVLANLHFSTTFLLLSTPRISWGASFVANLLYFYCIYGLASCISMLTRREDGPLLAVMMSLIVGVLSGMSPTLATVTGWHMSWLWKLSPGLWLAEGYFDQNISPLRYLYQIDDAAQHLGYTLQQFGFDLLMLFVIGTAYRVLAFLGLRFLNYHKQK